MPISSLLLLLACGGPARSVLDWAGPRTSQGEGHEPTRAALGGPHDTLVVAQMADFGTMNSVVAQSAADVALLWNLDRPLLTRGFDCGLKLSPGIASGWSFSEDGKELRMTLRDDLRWSDGRPFTAADVAFTYALVGDAAVASPALDYTERMDGPPQALDARTLAWRFTTAYDTTAMLAHASFVAPVPAHALADADRATLRGHPFSRAPLVTGSWRVADWRPGDRLVLEPRDNAPLADVEQTRLRRVVFRVIPEYATRLVELERGSVDLVESVEVGDVDRLAKRSDLTLYRRGWRSMDYIAWNSLDPADLATRTAAAAAAGEALDASKVLPHRIFGDARVRRALTMGIDIDRLITDLLTSPSGQVFGRRAVSTLSPEICSVHSEGIAPLPFDPAAARAALAEAGWVDRDGDGVREKDGVPLAFALRTNGGNPRRARVAVLVQAMLADVGARVSIEKLEANTFFAGLREKGFDAVISGWSASVFPDLAPMWHSGDRYPRNYTSYANPEVDALMDAALEELDPERAATLWRDAQARIYADQPYTFLYWRDDVVAVSARFKDAKIDALSPWRDLHTWWVPPDEVRYPR